MTAVVLALAAGVAATTITKAKAFSPLRVALKARSAWPGYLVSCPFCVTHWLVFVLQAVYQTRLVRSGAPALDVVVTAFPMIGLAALVPWGLHKLYRFAPDPQRMERHTTTLTVEDVRPFEGHIGGEIDVVGMVPIK